MQFDRLDISLSHYRHLDREHRAHIVLLGIVMLAIMSLHLLLLPHFPYERFYAVSFGFEVINWLTMLFLFLGGAVCPPAHPHLPHALLRSDVVDHGGHRRHHG